MFQSLRKALPRPHPTATACISLAAGLLLPFGFLIAADGTPPATITDLGPPPGFAITDGRGINNAQQVVGVMAVSPSGGYEASYHAFLYSHGTMMDLGTLGGFHSIARAINAAGQVVGYAETFGQSHAFLYSDGVMNDLGTLGGNYSDAYDINAAGQVVGYSSFPRDFNTRAFLYSDGVMTYIGSLDGVLSAATGINAAGQVVGWETRAGKFFFHAFLYSDGVMTDLGTLDGFPDSYANRINASGQIVGYASTSGNFTPRAFLYSHGAMTDLGTLGGDFSYPSDINAAGEIVGYSTTTGGVSHAFLYSRGAMTDLNSLLPAGSGWELKSAAAIDDAGRITGWGLINDQQRAFILDTRSTQHP
jgi:probable HAF family extracellular repeat protein